MTTKRIKTGGAMPRRSPPAPRNFIELEDCPTSYTGKAGQLPVVNGTETGLEFKTEAIIDRHDVQITNADTTPDFLNSKIAAGTGISTAVLNPAGNEQLQISLAAHDLAGALHNADTITNLNTKLSDGDVLSTKAAEISALTAKASPTTSDLLLIEDAAAGNAKKKITIADLPAAAPGGAAGGDLAGTYPNPTVKQASKAFAFNGIITDTIAAKKDDYNPAGLADANTIQLTLSGNQTITGLAGGAAGRIIIIQSGYTGSTDKLTLKNNSSDSAAANRFYCPLSSDFVLSDDNSVILQYDAIQQRWIVIATCQAPYGNAANTICEGNDPRLSDSRTPTAHDLAGALHNADTITNLNTKLSDGDVISTKAAEISALTAKTAPVPADLLLIEDSAAANAKKKITIANLAQAVFPEFQFFADQLRTPTGSEYPRYGSAAATIAQDSSNNAILIRQFDDTADEGAAFDVMIPAGATNLILDFVHRAQTAPASTKQVYPVLYTRQISDNVATPAWSAENHLTLLDIPNNARYQYDTLTISLSSLSLTAGLLTQFLLERDADEATDNLVGDWNLMLLKVRFS